MWIELHMLQNFAPSCLNRDDTNSPKDCVFGGYRRARISSQCIKRAIRWHPEFAGPFENLMGKRTWRLVERLRQELTDKLDVPAEQAVAVVPAVVKVIDDKMKDEETTSIGLFVGPDEIADLAAHLHEQRQGLLDARGKSGKLSADKAKGAMSGFEFRTKSPDIALFGRMVASKNVKDWNIDAACQVAHAISTHRAEMEMDFYTAVDDLNPAEEPGAGMMGTVGFNSSCFYRYALIDLDQLAKNLSGDRELAVKAVEGFLRAAVAAIPTGKQNSMAAQNPPSLILVVAKDGGAPWSLANAFEVPVEVRRDGKLVRESIEALARYWDDLVRVYGEGPVVTKGLCHLGEAELGGLADAKVETVEDVVAMVREAVGAGDA